MTWDEERCFDDAPDWYGADEAHAWASGYNAAVRAYMAETGRESGCEHSQV